MPCIVGALIVAVPLIPILMDWNTGVMLDPPRRDAWRDGRTRYRQKADHDHQPQEHDEAVDVSSYPSCSFQLPLMTGLTFLEGRWCAPV